VDSLQDGLSLSPVAILHPAHLDDAGVPLARVRELGVPVVVDAAYLSHPVGELARWSSASDFACFSAKYFWGPNGGGFVAGRADRIADLAALDFTGYESGAWRTFGRAFKLDRAAIVATVAALEEWVAMDHAARWAGYEAIARSLAERLPGAALRQFTMDERVVDGPVNAVVLPGAAALEGPLADGDPSIRAMGLNGDLVLCVEALAASEVGELADAVAAMWRAPAERSR
jgi:L-seryl-tRNA(Ser) seleniumtransferase